MNPILDLSLLIYRVHGVVDILSDKFISICNINIRGIRNKINVLHNFVDEFDIIVLTETPLDNSIENRDIELDSFADKQKT